MRAVFRHSNKVMTLIRHHLLSAGQFRLPFGENGYYDYFDKSQFVEVNNFEKRDTYFIFCYCSNKCFSGTMAFLCSMDVSMV